MIIGVGVDVVGVERFAASLERTPALLERLFTPAEQAIEKLESLAGRFAAKEAVAKVLGAPGLAWTDAEILNEDNGAPLLRVTGRAAELAAQRGITRWHLSISHDAGIATAFVVAES